MCPILVHFNLLGINVYIYAYTVFLILGVGLGTIVFIKFAGNLGIPDRIPGKLAALLVVSAVAGSRLMYVIQHPQQFSSVLTIVDPGKAGMAIFGGLLLMLISGFVYSRVRQIRIAAILDSMTMAMIAGIPLIRIGCFLNGCCYGELTSSTLGVSFPSGSIPYRQQIKEGLVKMFEQTLPVYPTQLFEMTAVILIGTVAFLVLRSRLKPGSACAVFFALYSVFRAFNAQLRFEGLVWYYPYIYSVVIAIALIYLIYANIFQRSRSYKKRY
ncbi:MAG: prolipoprotein diacylglyceryl transferase [Acidobacteriota bacterium]